MKKSTVSTRVEYNIKEEGSELYAKLEHSYKQSLAGEGRIYTEVFDELERSLT